MANGNSKRLAVLVDADNAQPDFFEEVLAEVSQYGTATVKRAYGNWTTQNLAGWKDKLHIYAIQPIQQFSYTSGKNSTDSALIIDAMDLLHGGKVDGFCLVSSDSDFTRLATRIRESGLSVFGFGKQNTPKAFVAACDKFIFTEILQSAQGQIIDDPEKKPLKDLLTAAISAASQDDGWAMLGPVGALIAKADPSFDERNYGFKKLGELVRAQPYLDVKAVPTSDGAQNSHLYVRLKKA